MFRFGIRTGSTVHSFRMCGFSRPFGALVAVLMALALDACSQEDLDIGRRGNKPPETWLEAGPPDGGVTGIEIDFRWGGSDPEVGLAYFEYVLTDNRPGGFDPADTTGRGAWTRSDAFEIHLTVSADQVDAADSTGWTFTRSHTFFVRGVDVQGRADPTPAYRSFTAKSLAPEVDIVYPPHPDPGDVQILPNGTRMVWSAEDENGTIPADSVRWGLFRAAIDSRSSLLALVDSLHLLLDDPSWTPWAAYVPHTDPDQGLGTSVWLEELEFPPSRFYAFAVQAKDRGGAATPTFDPHRNVRLLMTRGETQPSLIVFERSSGTIQFQYDMASDAKMTVPADLELVFDWYADESAYGRRIEGYRYGWDIVNPDEPSEWSGPVDPRQTSSAPVAYHFGTHVLTVEATDETGAVTTGRIEVETIPFTMERPLLWIDDARDAPFCTSLQRRPLAFCDQEHDQEWLAVLSHVEGFDPARDVYDVAANGFRPPSLAFLGEYRNIVWNTGGVADAPGVTPDALARFVEFVPWCVSGPDVSVNPLGQFLAKGGHIWMSGWNALSLEAPVASGKPGVPFPLVLKHELAETCLPTGAMVDPPGDSSGTYGFLYRHVGLVGIDRGVNPAPREGVSPRDPLTDGLYDLSAVNPNFPEIELLNLGGGLQILVGIPNLSGRELFIGPDGGYTHPVTGDRFGFEHADVLDPQYWLERPDVAGPLRRAEFLPLWQYRASGASVLDGHIEVSGGWSTVHGWRLADIPGGGKGVMAMSLYMGFEPYYFEFEQFRLVANYVFFKEWQLGYQP